MTTVAKGTKKPSHGSNMSLATMEFLMKGQVLGGKRIVGYLLPWKPNLLPWQPKKGVLWINLELMTMEFLMKGQMFGGKRIVGYLLLWKPICCHGNQKRELC